MTDFAAQLTSWLNVPANALGRWLLGWVAHVPPWLSNTIISIVLGVLLLILFKYTSNQRAIGRTKDQIKANMLAMKLYKDSIAVTLKVQAQLFGGALMLLLHAVRPMLVMMIPVCLVLAQMSLWYQSRPLREGEYAVVTVQLADNSGSNWPEVSLDVPATVRVTIGPVRITTKREICWEIQAQTSGSQPLVFNVGEKVVTKQLVIGDGMMPVSIKRPGRQWTQILQHPLEKPLESNSLVQSIDIDYPDRISRVSGTNWWVIYCLVVSLVAAMLLKPLLKVKA